MTEDYYSLEQVEMALQAAERLVGQATESMNSQQLQNATHALSDARQKLEQAKIQGRNYSLLQYPSSRLNRLSHQIHDAVDC